MEKVFNIEEVFNAVTHGIGTLLAVAALITLTVASYVYGTVWHRVSFAIYGASLVLLYLASTLYHAFRREKLKFIFKICDHMAIYLLIAGTYTPFALVALHGPLGWTVMGVIWGLAAVGMVWQLFFVKRFKIVSTLCYIGMGWLMVIAIKPLAMVLSGYGLFWLFLGGAFYTVGAVFYLWRRLPYNHAVWHMFVLAGSACHFIAVLGYVLPLSVTT